MYHALLTCYNIKSKWLDNVRKILSDAGRNDVWVNHNDFIPSSIKLHVKQTQYLQYWRSELTKMSKGINYSLFKASIQLEPHLLSLPNNLYINMIRFRTGNHRMLIEVGRWDDSDISDKKCIIFSTNSIGDECHYLLQCSYLRRDRQRLIPTHFFERPNSLKYKKLLSTRDEICLTNLGKFIRIIIKKFS